MSKVDLLLFIHKSTFPSHHLLKVIGTNSITEMWSAGKFECDIGEEEDELGDPEPEPQPQRPAQAGEKFRPVPLSEVRVMNYDGLVKCQTELSLFNNLQLQDGQQEAVTSLTDGDWRATPVFSRSVRWELVTLIQSNASQISLKVWLCKKMY